MHPVKRVARGARALLASASICLATGCSGLVCGGEKQGARAEVEGWTLTVECSWERNESGGGGGRGGMSTPSEGCHGGWFVRAEREAAAKKTIDTRFVLGVVSCLEAKRSCSEKRGTFARRPDAEGTRVAVDVGGAEATGIYLPTSGEPFRWNGPLPRDAQQAVASMPSYDEAVDAMLDGKVSMNEDLFASLTAARARKHRAALERAKKRCNAGDILCNYIERVLAPLE